MHRDLRGFLLIVWDTATKAGGTFELIDRENERLSQLYRRTIDSPEHDGPGSAEVLRRMVYAVYNKAETSAPGLQQSEVPGWLATASKLGAKLTMRLQVGDQFKDFAKAYTAYVTGRDSLEEDEAALKTGFIHYINDSSPHPDAMVRVYVNPDPRHALHLLEHLLDSIDSEIEAARLFTSCKIAGPLALGKRSDGILVYCGTREVAKGVVRVLKGAPPGWFNPETPDLTEKVEDLDFGVGISIGEEPPEVAMGLRNTGRSFGSLRSEIIAAALLAETAYAERDFTRFKDAVEAGFRGYGLDPNNPAWNLSE